MVTSSHEGIYSSRCRWQGAKGIIQGVLSDDFQRLRDLVAGASLELLVFSRLENFVRRSLCAFRFGPVSFPGQVEGVSSRLTGFF